LKPPAGVENATEVLVGLSQLLNVFDKALHPILLAALPRTVRLAQSPTMIKIKRRRLSGARPR
jgi:hypothetical protein